MKWGFVRTIRQWLITELAVVERLLWQLGHVLVAVAIVERWPW